MMHKDFYSQEPIAGLSGVRLAIAHLLIQGDSAPQIARRLCLSLSSIKKYVVGLKEDFMCGTVHGLTAKLMRLRFEEKTKKLY